MEARYKQAAELGEAISHAFVNVHVHPYWIKDTHCFWFRQHITNESFKFVIVQMDTGETRPAFDHEELQTTLRRHGIQASATTLPFREFTIEQNFNIIKFRVDDKLWQYECDSNKLSICDEEDQENNHMMKLRPLEKEVASHLKSPKLKSCLKFINKRSRTIRISWIDYEGDSQMSKTAAPGESCQRSTWAGHVWRVCDDETGLVIASFLTPYQETAFVMIDDEIAAMCANGSAPDTESPQPCFVKNFNVYVTGKGSPDVQLSSCGSKDNPFDPDLIYHSDDMKYACVVQYTPEGEASLYHIESTPSSQLQPLLQTKQYPRPGDRVRIDRPKLFDLVEGKEVAVSDVLFNNPYELDNIGWSPDSQKYRFIYNERGHKVLRVIELGVDGNVRTLVEERQETFVDYAKIDWRYEKDTDELVWLSERDGSNHLYLIKLDGALAQDCHLAVRQLTHGSGNVRRIDHVDFGKEKRQIYVAMLGAVAGQDPYYMHLAKVDVNDSSFTVLTTGDGNHEWTWSPDFKYFIDEWSRVDEAPQAVVRDLDGKFVLDLHKSHLENLISTGWRTPERFTAPGRDGTTPIYGIIIRPSDFSPDKCYPVVEKIYAGPHGFSVPKSFSKLSELYVVAELGFVVVMIDGMGTNWRGRTFHEVCYKNLRDAGLPDRITWIKMAAKTRPWMDVTRVGISGCSAGGQNALAALLWHGDFYKAAIADCGCHDNRLDKLCWNEQWMGWPVDEAYEENSNVVHAHRLKGALMLIVGELDSNVDPACTMQVVHALNRAEKDYELLVVPGGRHGVGDSTKYLVRRQLDFFVRHLIGVEAPDWNAAEMRKKLSICYGKRR